MTPTRSRPPGAALGALLAVGLTVATGALAYGAVPGRIRVHWSLGMGPYVGPETLPKALGLSVIPAVAVVTVAGLWLLRHALDLESEPRARRYHDRATLLVACFLFAGQTGIVLANL